MDSITNFYNDTITYFQENYLNIAFTIGFVVLGFITANFVKRRIKSRLANKSPNHLTANFISQIVSFVIKAIVIFVTLYMLGLDSFTTKVLAGAGILTFVIGFALKDIGENFLAGIILAFKSPFKLNDLIEVNGIIGFVRDISIRETLIKTRDGKDVFLPNAIILKNPLHNYTIDGFLRYEFEVGIAYEDNPTEAIKVIFEILQNNHGVLKGDKSPSVTINELATNTISLQVQFWVDTFKSTKTSVHDSIRSQIMSDVVSSLLSKGYSLPASIVELKNYDSSQPLQHSVSKKD
jgi:small-conductance mechanosensitive channel